MSKNYAALAGTVITALGGADNVVAVTHCMMRLRFVLGDPARVNGPALKAITGVLGVVQAGRLRFRRLPLAGACAAWAPPSSTP
ncbi:PTS transporter subunit EIIB [Aeromonas caviae]